MSVPTALQRVFPDSNVLIEGLFAHWSASRAILILARTRAFRLVLSPYVEAEVERALLNRLARDAEEGSRLIDDYARALTLLAPERTSGITHLRPLPIFREWEDGPERTRSPVLSPDRSRR
jgi:predicted nucleic acid-binding protein